MSKRIILGVQVTDRLQKVPEVQKILTQYGGNIKTRLGLHDVSPKSSVRGLLLLETCGREDKIIEFEKKLKKIKGLVVKKMTFEG